MLVTDKQYSMDKQFIAKIDLMCDRSSGKSKLDNLLIIDGDEGFGKTTMSVAIGYYAAWKLKRPFSVKNLFFDLDKLIDFAIKTKEQIIIWDEAAMGGLAVEWNTATQKKLLKLLMAVRKKKHFFIFNIPRVFKLNEYIVVDRAIGLVHVYSRDGKHLGRFVYFKNKKLEKLYFDWRRSRKRNYKKHYSLRGTFPDVITRHKIIDEEEYDKNKDKAIESIQDKKGIAQLKSEQENIKLKHKISQIKDQTKEELAEHFGVTSRVIYNWTHLPLKYPKLLGESPLLNV